MHRAPYARITVCPFRKHSNKPQFFGLIVNFLNTVCCKHCNRRRFFVRQKELFSKKKKVASLKQATKSSGENSTSKYNWNGLTAALGYTHNFCVKQIPTNYWIFAKSFSTAKSRIALRILSRSAFSSAFAFKFIESILRISSTRFVAQILSSFSISFLLCHIQQEIFCFIYIH